MQNLNSKFSHRNKTAQNYLNAIKSSIEHLFKIENHIDRINSIHENYYQSGYEPLHISKVNYLAIIALEKLGLTEPTQKQIDAAEILILLLYDSKHLTSRKFHIGAGVDSIRKHTLLRVIRKGLSPKAT